MKKAKEDNISANTPEERSRAAVALERVKKAQKGKEFVAVPIFNGYKFIEKSKYERINSQK